MPIIFRPSPCVIVAGIKSAKYVCIWCKRTTYSSLTETSTEFYAHNMIPHDISDPTSSARFGLNMRTYRIGFFINTNDKDVKRQLKVAECKSIKEIEAFENGESQGVGCVLKKANINRAMKNVITMNNTIKE